VDVKFFVAVNNSVTSVVTALSPAAELRLAAKNINELTFTFITPLRA